MQPFKVICIVITLLLLLVASTSAVFYDDEGKAITEDDIRTEIQLQHRKTGCMWGGCGCGALFFILGYNFMSEGEDEESEKDFIMGSVIIAVSYLSDKYIKRREAVKSIKEKRRTQKQSEDKESLTDT